MSAEEAAHAVPPLVASPAPIPSDDMVATERGDIHMSENVAYMTNTKGHPSQTLAPNVATGETESSCVSVANVLYEGLPAEAAAN